MPFFKKKNVAEKPGSLGSGFRRNDTQDIIFVVCLDLQDTELDAIALSYQLTGLYWGQLAGSPACRESWNLDIIPAILAPWPNQLQPATFGLKLPLGACD